MKVYCLPNLLLKSGIMSWLAKWYHKYLTSCDVRVRFWKYTKQTLAPIPTIDTLSYTFKEKV